MNEMLALALEIFGALTVISGGIAVILKAIKAITDKHDEKQKYDDYDTRIKGLEGQINGLNNKINQLEMKTDAKITEAHKFAQEALEEMQKANAKKLEDVQRNIDGKLQQISSELCMLSYCTLANLDGLKQQGCNGKVTEAREKLEKHLNQQAHGEINNDK